MRDRIITAKEMKAFLGFISALFWALVATAAVTGYQFGIDYAVLNLLLAVIVRQLLLETALFGLVKMLVGAATEAADTIFGKLAKAARNSGKGGRNDDEPAPDSQDDEYLARVARDKGGGDHD